MASGLLEFCIAQWRADGALRARDAYKWLYQATLGCGHAVSGNRDARAELEQEWEQTGEPFPDEPKLVQLEPAGRLLRLNLRPYKANGGDMEHLLTIFVESARLHRADLRTFLDTWRGLGRRLREEGPVEKIDFDGWLSVDKVAVRQGYPVIHDSEDYLRQRHPSYRVILSHLCEPK